MCHKCGYDNAIKEADPQSGKAAPYGSGYAPVKNKNK